jgi:thiol-disulfide isomerase/thioredoxin
MFAVTKHKNKIIVLLLILLVSGVVLYWYTNNPKNSANQAALSFKTPKDEQSYTDLAGMPIDLSDYVGETVVAISWASWCPVCDEELLKLQQLATEIDNKNLILLAINRSEPRTTAERYLKSIGDLSHVQLVLDPDDRHYRAINGYAMPETVVYDSRGTIVTHVRGAIESDSLKEVIKNSL